MGAGRPSDSHQEADGVGSPPEACAVTPQVFGKSRPGLVGVPCPCVLGVWGSGGPGSVALLLQGPQVPTTGYPAGPRTLFLKPTLHKQRFPGHSSADAPSLGSRALNCPQAQPLAQTWPEQLRSISPNQAWPCWPSRVGRGHRAAESRLCRGPRPSTLAQGPSTQYSPHPKQVTWPAPL